MRRTRYLPSLLALGAALIAGCSAAQAPSADLSKGSDASVSVDRWQLTATGTRIGDDQFDLAMVVSRTTDPPRVISEPRILLTIGESGTIEVLGDSFDVSVTADSSLVDGRIVVDINAAIREGGILKSTLRIRMSIE
ncbi:MAG: hypothetical protein OSA40_01510 [Phycisphaerales bacterium]|nr:hypothetical protein [Phycisphaerales bacterium]